MIERSDGEIPQFTRLPARWNPYEGLSTREEAAISMWLGIDVDSGEQIPRSSYEQIADQLDLSTAGAGRLVKQGLMKLASMYFTKD